jgi:hypothetical protein
MKRAFIHALAAATLLAGAPAMAQTSTTTTTRDVGATGSITIAPEQRTKIKEYVIKEKRASKPAPSGFTVSMGATLPSDVELYAFAPDVGVKEYRYTVIGNKTVLVEPGSRRIVQIIE